LIVGEESLAFDVGARSSNVPSRLSIDSAAAVGHAADFRLAPSSHVAPKPFSVISVGEIFAEIGF
jgi:hypothetical protein